MRPFLVGRHVVLAVPEIEADVRNGPWAQWFNDPKVTRYLSHHGAWPNTVEQQVAFVEEAERNPATLLLCIKTPAEHLIGAISLSHIDLINRTADIALVLGATHYPIARVEPYGEKGTRPSVIQVRRAIVIRARPLDDHLGFIQ